MAILVVGCILCAFCASRFRQTMEQETDRYLAEISRHVAALVDDRVESDLKALETAADNWNITGSRELGFRRLENLALRYGFERLGVVDLDGRVETTDGFRGDMTGMPALSDALAGKRRVALEGPIGGEASILYLLPVRQDGEVAGVLTASVSKDRMRGLLGVESFGGEGYSQIVTTAGDFVVESDHANAPRETENLFRMLSGKVSLERGASLEDLEADMAAGRDGLVYFHLPGGESASMCYVKLAAEDWYLLSIVPGDVTGAQTRSFSHMAVVVNAVIMGLFLALTLLILWQGRRARRELERLALVDPVTGGMNRQCFEREAAKAVASAPPGTWILVSLDLYRFKLINDAFGSGEGNRTLRYVHGVLHRHLGEGELIGRMSADVFSLLLRCRTRKELIAWLEEAAAEVNAFNDSLPRKYFLSLAAGAYLVDEAGLDMITIQDRANVARKKQRSPASGRLCTCVFYADVERLRLLREKEIDDRKEAALRGREFVVYLQPKVELKTGRVAGAEALVRWQDPDHGLIQPDEFIPAFERSGFITRLDLYVFEETCRLLRRWADQGLEPVPVSVNLSRIHLSDPDFLRRFKAARDWYGIPGRYLEFEFTETVATENPAQLTQVIDQLHAEGFGCALDDFGSGYSSLNILKDMPVDVLKLDRAFLAGAGVKDDRGRYVVESVVALARRLDMRTVCEGVEDASQVEFLRRCGCDMVQGFVFSRPVPAEEFERMAFGGGPGMPDREEVTTR